MSNSSLHKLRAAPAATRSERRPIARRRSKAQWNGPCSPCSSSLQQVKNGRLERSRAMKQLTESWGMTLGSNTMLRMIGWARGRENTFAHPTGLCTDDHALGRIPCFSAAGSFGVHAAYQTMSMKGRGCCTLNCNDRCLGFVLSNSPR